MKRLCNSIGTFDTVEEYWDEQYLEQAFLYASEMGDKAISQFEADCLSFLGANGTGIFVRSGRDALQMALSLLENKNAESVLVPDFTCTVVGKAILQAGFKINVFDFIPTVDGLNLERLERIIRSERVGAVIIPHLFGLPCDIGPLLEITRRRNIPVIEDCAHCFGGKVDGVAAGLLGDFSIFSFNYDKPISLGGGGMLICNPSSYVSPETLEAVKLKVALNLIDPLDEQALMNNFISWLCSRRKNISRVSLHKYDFGWLKARVKNLLRLFGFRKIGTRASLIPSWSSGVGSLRAALGVSLLDEYSSVLNKRNENFHIFENYVEAYDIGWLMKNTSERVDPAWIKAKLIIHGKPQGEIDMIGRQLCALGYRVGRFNWPTSLSEEFPNAIVSIENPNEARRMAQLSLDFPIHQNMGSDDVDRMMQNLLKLI